MWRHKVAAASSRCAEAGSLRHVFGFSRWPELAAAFTCFKGHTQEKEEGALADSQDKARFLIGCIPEKRYSPRWWRPNFSKKGGTRPPSPREVNSRGSSPAVGRFAPSGLPLLFPRLIEMIRGDTPKMRTCHCERSEAIPLNQIASSALPPRNDKLHQSSIRHYPKIELIKITEFSLLLCISSFCDKRRALASPKNSRV